jgi:hypothetical protein
MPPVEKGHVPFALEALIQKIRLKILRRCNEKKTGTQPVFFLFQSKHFFCRMNLISLLQF